MTQSIESAPPAASREAPGHGPLASRVRAAVALLANASTVEVVAPPETPDRVTVRGDGQEVVLVEARALDRVEEEWVADTIAQAIRGTVALIVVGAPAERLEALLSRGVYDLLEENAPPARTMLALRNALAVLELKARADGRARLVRRYRYEAGVLAETARALTQERDLNKLLTLILEKSRFLAGADAGSLYVVEGTDPQIEKRKLRFKLSQNDSVSFPTGEFTVPVSMRSIAGSVAITRKTVSLDDVYNLPADAPFAFDRSFDAKVGYRTRSILTVPLVSAQDEVIGVVQLINKKRDPRAKLRSPSEAESEVVPFDERSAELVGSLAAQAGIALENAMLYEEIRRIFEGFVKASVMAIEQRDPTTKGHSMRVSVLSVKLAEAVDRTDAGPYKEARFGTQDLRELEYASLLHDFGKIGVREQVLVKAKKLYDWQLQLIRSRFDYLHKNFDAEASLRRAELIGLGAGESDLRKAADEHQERSSQLEVFWALIRDANEPTVLPQGSGQRLEELALRTWTDPRGQEHPWLRNDELECLKVARGSLTSDEMNEIRSHVTHTFDFLSRIPWGKSFARVPILAGCHHEKLNGRGYPRGLSGDDIPVGSRIMAIADIFDALTAADRPYKKAVPVDRALQILDMEVRDGGLDGELVRIFVDAGVYRSMGEGGSY